MRTVEEIRQHREDLRQTLITPCNCDRTGHRLECRAGARIMCLAIDVLTWALGEETPYEVLVERARQ